MARPLRLAEAAVRSGVADVLESGMAASRALGMAQPNTVRMHRRWTDAENAEARRHAMEVRKRVHEDMAPVLTKAWELAIKEIERRLGQPEDMSENGLKNLVISLAVTTDKWKGLTSEETTSRFGGKKGSAPAEADGGVKPVDLASIIKKHQGAG